MRPDTDDLTDDPQEQDAVRINRVVWASRAVAICLTAAVVSFFLYAEADEGWKYLAYPTMAALPLLYGILSARHIRLTHVGLLQRYQARLIMRTIELEKMASQDELTHLHNRRFFYERLQGELARARSSKQTLALVILDIDGLKNINDEYGHAVGDVMIASLASVIRRHIRGGDVGARLGGDEFAILMPDTDKRGAFSFAQRLWQELEQVPMYEHDGMSLMLNVSIGVSGFPWGGEDVDEMMHWADADMYANKVSRRLPQGAAAGLEQTLRDTTRVEELDWI